MKRKKRGINPVVVVVILIALVAVIGVASTLIIRRIPTKKQMNLTEYYGETSDTEAVIIIGTQILDARAALSGDQPYLPLDVVNSYLNQRYYWDAHYWRVPGREIQYRIIP